MRRVPHARLRPGRTAIVVAAGLAAVLLAGALVDRRLHAQESTVSFQDLEESLTCQCGCGLTVHSCNHLQCPSAIPLREEIRSQMALGKDKTAILAYFADKYGEKILSAPTTSGFNVVAWITPFLVVTIGAILLALVVVRWTQRGRAAGAPPPGPAGPGPAESPYSKILEKELEDFDR